ncbi:hypothetical protein [Aeromonas caviae]|nr:hypothetical protein [Aeromonas caviae]
MLDLLNLPGIKPVDMRHEGKCLVIVAECIFRPIMNTNSDST